MMQYRSSFIVALLLSGVGACSTLNYQQPITQFSQGVSDLNAAFNALKVTRNNAAINNLANSLGDFRKLIYPLDGSNQDVPFG